MDPHPLRLLETAHPLRPSTLSEGPPTPRLTPCQRLLTTPIKKLDGPTQMSRPRPDSAYVAAKSCSRRMACRKDDRARRSVAKEASIQWASADRKEPIFPA